MSEPFDKKTWQLIIFDWEGTLAWGGSYLFDGVPQLLAALQSRYTLAVATNNSRDSLDELLHMTQLSSYFSTTRCADETAYKPDPRMLKEILWELTIPPQQALMIGDSVMDFHMAKAAGMESIVISPPGQHFFADSSRPLHIVPEIGAVKGILL